MKKETEELVKEAFKEITGRGVKKVMSLTGDPPSENNSYLYSVAFDQYEGRLIDEANFEYIFFIFRQDGAWFGEFVPVDS